MSALLENWMWGEKRISDWNVCVLKWWMQMTVNEMSTLESDVMLPNKKLSIYLIESITLPWETNNTINRRKKKRSKRINSFVLKKQKFKKSFVAQHISEVNHFGKQKWKWGTSYLKCSKNLKKRKNIEDDISQRVA